MRFFRNKNLFRCGHLPRRLGCRTFEEMQADSPIDLISRELLLSSLHPGVSCFEGAQKGAKCGMPVFFFFF